MNKKMVFFNRPYKIPATINKVLKYDEISEEEREEAFHQISLEDPLKPKEENEDKKEDTEEEEKTIKKEEDLKLKEKLIFFKVIPLSQYQYKEKNEKDVIIYAPYALLIPNPKIIQNSIIKLKPRQFVITENGYYGMINNINFNQKTASVDCFLPSQSIDGPIREIVKKDSENYLTEEEFAKQVGITPESVPLIAAQLKLMPDNSNISIKFYSIEYDKFMCGFCFQDKDNKFLFSKEAVAIAKKYLNQPKIFKLLIEQSAAQTKIRIKNEQENESKNTNEDPEINVEEVKDDSEKTEDQLNENSNNIINEEQNSNITEDKRLEKDQDQGEKEQDQGDKKQSNDDDLNNQNYEEDEKEEFVEQKNSKKRVGRKENKRMIYLNEPETESEEEFTDSVEIELPTDGKTEKDPPFSIKLPMQIRGTIISRLDKFFKHHNTVYASIFYHFGSTCLSIESIHNIDQILSQKRVQPKNKGQSTEKLTKTFPLDQLINMNEYIRMENQSFKAGDRIILQENRGFGVFGKYGTIICASDDRQKAVVCLDTPFYPGDSITFTNYRMKNNFSSDCVIELPYFVMKLVEHIE